MFIFVVKNKVRHSAAISKRPGIIVPGTFYFSGVAPQDWTLPQNNDLWQDAVKTLYDPCPAGWRVPQSGIPGSGKSPWNAFSLDNSTWQPSEGRIFHTVVYEAIAAETWYPAAGYRLWANGLFSLVTHEQGCMASTKENGYVHYLYSTATDVNPYGCNGGWPAPAIGFPVRCIRE